MNGYKATEQAVFYLASNGTVYRFTDCKDHGTHWTGRSVNGDNVAGEMLHRIPNGEIINAVITPEVVHTKEGR